MRRPHHMSAVVVPLLAIAALAGGCDGKWRSGGGGGGGEVLRLDLAEVTQELKDDRPAAINRYVGKTLEVEVESITVAAEGVTRIILRLVPVTNPGDSLSIVYEGTFVLDDPRNDPLKGAKSGPFRAVVRGVLVSIREEDRQGNINTLVISPAWIERLN